MHLKNIGFAFLPLVCASLVVFSNAGGEAKRNLLQGMGDLEAIADIVPLLPSGEGDAVAPGIDRDHPRQVCQWDGRECNILINFAWAISAPLNFTTVPADFFDITGFYAFGCMSHYWHANCNGDSYHGCEWEPSNQTDYTIGKCLVGSNFTMALLKERFSCVRPQTWEEVPISTFAHCALQPSTRLCQATPGCQVLTRPAAFSQPYCVPSWYNSLDDTQRQALMCEVNNRTSRVWAECPGAQVVFSFYQTCPHRSQQECNADVRCLWRAQHGRCLPKDEASLAVLFGDAASAGVMMEAVEKCDEIKVHEACDAFRMMPVPGRPQPVAACNGVNSSRILNRFLTPTGFDPAGPSMFNELTGSWGTDPSKGFLSNGGNPAIAAGLTPGTNTSFYQGGVPEYVNQFPKTYSGGAGLAVPSVAMLVLLINVLLGVQLL